MSSDETNNQPAPSSPSLDEQISGIAVLGDPLRRALYRHVISQPGPVNRDQVAEGAGVARHVVKFHLDRLADDGLLDVEYARPAGRAGPGAGRPAKLYRRSARELAVSLPPRDYELAGRLLAQAVTEAERDGIRVADALARAARSTGQALGRQARQLAGPRPSQLSLLAAAINVLIDCGYEPARWRRAPHAGELPVPRARRGLHRPRVRDEPRSPARARGGRRSRSRGPPRTGSRFVLRTPPPHPTPDVAGWRRRVGAVSHRPNQRAILCPGIGEEA